jgi:hypothetical protein
LKTNNEGLELEFEILEYPENQSLDTRKQEIGRELQSIEALLSENDARLEALNKEIDRLTNHADGWDYLVAVGGGVLAGIVDSLWVGEFSFSRGSAWGEEKVNSFVLNTAQSQGYEGKDLKGAVAHLEKKFGAPSDSVTPAFGGGLQHHLRDFAHHPTPVGLIFSMLTQFTGKAYGTNKNGVFMVVDIENKAFIGDGIGEKFLYGTVYWFFHLVSDMAGSSSFAGAGTGLPGPVTAFLKEISALPFFKSANEEGVKDFSLWISKLFNGTLFAEHDEKGKIIKESVQAMRMDLRKELGVVHELGRQALPVILNECIVRGFYFIRRLIMEIKEKDIRGIRDLKRVEWGKVLPVKNRTIVRMLTIATGTFTAIDLADAAIRSAVTSGGVTPLFAKNMLLRVNFVGVGRFAIAIGTEVGYAWKRSKASHERMAVMSRRLFYLNAKVFYHDADMWLSVEASEEAIHKATTKCEEAILYFLESSAENEKSLEKIVKHAKEIKENDPEFAGKIVKTLKRG